MIEVTAKILWAKDLRLHFPDGLKKQIRAIPFLYPNYRIRNP
jgi:hypothetical protein